MNRWLKDLDFTVYTTIEKVGSSGERRLIRGYASVGDVLDRQNEVITLSALVKAREDLLENNTIFYEHKHSELPIGKTIQVDIDEKGLLITVEISKAPFVDSIWTLIQEGILDSFSIGGRVLEAEEKRDDDGNLFNEITQIELFETSIVGLPANPAAKFELISKSFGMAITEEMRKREVSNKMAKENKGTEKTQETFTSNSSVDSTTLDLTAGSGTIDDSATSTVTKSEEEVKVETEKSEEKEETKKEVEKSEESEKEVEKKEDTSEKKEVEKSEDNSEEEKSEDKSKEEVSKEKDKDKDKDLEEDKLEKAHSNNATDENDLHWHEAAVDADGNGETTTIVTKEGYTGDANHSHDVVDGVVQESDGHPHELIAPVEVEASTETETDKSEEKEEDNAEKDTSLEEASSEEKSEEEEESVEEEKSFDEQIMETLSKILEHYTKKEDKKESEEGKEEVEASTKENSEQSQEECECVKSEDKVDVTKSEGTSEKSEESQKEVKKDVEKVVKIEDAPKEEEKSKEKEIPSRKGEVIIAETPYASSVEEKEVSKAILKKKRDEAWKDIVFGKKQ